MENKYTDEQFNNKNKYIHNTPYDKESLYYREVSSKFYSDKYLLLCCLETTIYG